jgi:hypothetical protein
MAGAVWSMLSRPFTMIAGPASYRPANHGSAARSIRSQVLVMAECTTPPKVGSPKTANREAENPTQSTSSDKGIHCTNIACTSVKLTCVLVGVGLHSAACWLAIQCTGWSRTGQSLAGISRPTLLACDGIACSHFLNNPVELLALSLTCWLLAAGGACVPLHSSTVVQHASQSSAVSDPVFLCHHCSVRLHSGLAPSLVRRNRFFTAPCRDLVVMQWIMRLICCCWFTLPLLIRPFRILLVREKKLPRLLCVTEGELTSPRWHKLRCHK